MNASRTTAAPLREVARPPARVRETRATPAARPPGARLDHPGGSTGTVSSGRSVTPALCQDPASSPPSERGKALIPPGAVPSDTGFPHPEGGCGGYQEPELLPPPPPPENPPPPPKPEPPDPPVVAEAAKVPSAVVAKLPAPSAMLPKSGNPVPA